MLNDSDSNLAMNAICNAAHQAGQAWVDSAYAMLAKIPEGVTLRDIFAMAALPGIIANPASWVRCETPVCKLIAGSAYEFADSMLEAKEGMTDWEHECHGLIYWIKGLEADCEGMLKRARNEGLSKSGAINFIDETRRRCAGIDDEFKRMKKPPSQMESTRLIPTTEVSPEYTNASMRKLLREAHGRNNKLLQLCKDALCVLNAHAVGHKTQEALEAAITEIEGSGA